MSQRDPRKEMESQQGLVFPSLRRTLVLFGRAFALRCPHCGKGPVLHHWLRLRVKCGTCGLRLQRGEHDSFVGSALILFVLAGFFTYGVLLVALLVTDETPWGLLENGLPLVLLVAVPAFFPFAKLLWLAFDLLLRPVGPDELEWHRAADAEFETERDARR
jgi:uncharacterized protein (DUF983 family)